MPDHDIGPTIGQRIAQLRGSRITQTALAGRAEVSVDLIRKLEQGRRHTVSIASLHRIARALDVDAGELLGKRTGLPDPGEHAGAVAIRRALTHVDDLIGGDDDVEPLTVDEARRAASYGWGAYWAGRYDQLGQLLPTALLQTRATLRSVQVAEQPAAADIAAQVHQLAASTLVHLGHTDVAHLALRQALEHAARGSDPLRIEAIHGTLAWVLLAEGRFIESGRLAAVAAQSISPTGTSPLPAWSLYGSLLLSGATAAGRDGNRAAAAPLLDEAEQAAARTGDRNDFETVFGGDQVQMQRVDVDIVTEHYSAALTGARAMPRDAALPVAARARHLSDVALAQTRLGHDGAALDTLLAMETLAPSWTAYQAQPRQIVRELRERAATPPRLTDLARRLGVVHV